MIEHEISGQLGLVAEQAKILRAELALIEGGQGMDWPRLERGLENARVELEHLLGLIRQGRTEGVL